MSETNHLSPQREISNRRRRIIDQLRLAGALTAEQIDRLLNDPHDPPLTLDDELEVRQFLSRADMVTALANYNGLECARLDNCDPDPNMADVLPQALARRHLAFPLAWSGDVLEVAIADPSDIVGDDAVRRAVGRPVEFFVAGESELQHLIEQLYGPSDEAMRELHGLSVPYLERLDTPQSGWLSSQDLEYQAERLPTIRICNQLLGGAAQRGASDIHIEPQEANIAVRLRVDGVMIPFITLPKSTQSAVCSRLKLMGNMDISDTRRPQDGRCRVTFNRKILDLRMSSLPTTYGEKLVIRLLDQSSVAVTMDTLEMDAPTKESLERMMAQPQGMILVTGPTGSGKSTTLYGCLQHLKSANFNIVTVEDPVERQLAGISQVAINERAGVTFASALKSILRQDPNVIMIGEIRDEETAQIALQASLTGHLVLATLHTNDTASTVTRLLDMGVAGNLLGPALMGIVAQRLVRRICASCKGQVTEDPVHPRGCQDCSYTGYKGRVGLFELLEITPQLSGLISKGATAEELRGAARKLGMKSLAENALDKVDAGITTIEEVTVAVDANQLHSARAMRDGKSSRNAPEMAEESHSASATQPSSPEAAPIEQTPAPHHQPPPWPGYQPHPAYAPPNLYPAPHPGMAPQIAPQMPSYPPYQQAPYGLPVQHPYQVPMQQPQYAPAGSPGSGDGPGRAYLERRAAPDASSSSSSRSSGARTQRSTPKILVAEDSRSIRTMLAEVLQKNFYEVVEAEDGLEGLRLAIEHMPDLVLADVVMPSMDGYDLCKRLRSRSDTRHIPVIMLTSQDRVEQEVRGLEVGADDYIAKPVDVKRLLARIHVVIRRADAC